MKQLILRLLPLTVLALALFPQPLHAQVLDKVCEETPSATVCQESDSEELGGNSIYGPDGVLTKVANVLSIALGVISVFAIMIGGIKYVLSGGDPSKTNNARSTILYAVIGLVVAALAQAMILFILNRL
jgi:hypothetical protein